MENIKDGIKLLQISKELENLEAAKEFNFKSYNDVRAY